MDAVAREQKSKDNSSGISELRKLVESYESLTDCQKKNLSLLLFSKSC